MDEDAVATKLIMVFEGFENCIDRDGRLSFIYDLCTGARNEGEKDYLAAQFRYWFERIREKTGVKVANWDFFPASQRNVLRVKMYAPFDFDPWPFCDVRLRKELTELIKRRLCQAIDDLSPPRFRYRRPFYLKGKEALHIIPLTTWAMDDTDSLVKEDSLERFRSAMTGYPAQFISIERPPDMKFIRRLLWIKWSQDVRRQTRHRLAHDLTETLNTGDKRSWQIMPEESFRRLVRQGRLQ